MAFAEGVDNRTFSSVISVPGTRIRKTADCFIQWRDVEKGGAWGLNFMSEADCLRFLAGCSPPTLTPDTKRMRHTLSTHSLMLPIPAPPTKDSIGTSNNNKQLLEVLENNNNKVSDSGYVYRPVSPGAGSFVSEVDFLPTPYASNVGLHRILNASSPSLCYSPPPEFDDDYQRKGEEVQSSSIRRSTCSLPENLQAQAEEEASDSTTGNKEDTEVSVQEEERESAGNKEPTEAAVPEENESVPEENDSVPELFKPSMVISEEDHILPDIAEESEDENDPLKKSAAMENNTLKNKLDNLIEEASGGNEVEISETDFSALHSTAEEEGSGKVIPEASSLSGSPSLPLSPPPGPMLPRLSQFISSEAPPGLEGSPPLPPRLASSNNKHSAVSLTEEDTPPPLPTSLPPGKVISPRHSIVGSPNLSVTNLIGGSEGVLDLAQLNSKITQIVTDKTGEEVEIKSNTVEDSEDELSSEEENLPPPHEPEGAELEEERSRKAKLKITPSFLRSLSPPREFSSNSDDAEEAEGDGGVVDVVDGATTELPSPPRAHGQMSHPLERAAKRDSSLGQSDLTFLLPSLGLGQKSGSATTSVSDDRLTDHSNGSVGLKTTVSTGSLRSSNSLGSASGGGGGRRGDIEEDSGSVTTELGGERESRRNVGPPGLKQNGAALLRKAGWVELKMILVRKNKKVAMKSKRKWRKYWAILKGSTLNFYQSDDPTVLNEASVIDLKLDIELGLAHSVPDHVKRDHILCLSTSNGNAYYMQSNSQSEVEDWITAIHSAAATALTQQLNREEATRILKNKTESLDEMIKNENRLKKMAELNLTTISDYASRSAIARQLLSFTENIEKYNVELYRIRCYMASIQGTEIPNPQSLLGNVSKPTKSALGRVGIFSVASLHAMVSARHGCAQLGNSSGYSTLLSKAKISSPALASKFISKRRGSGSGSSKAGDKPRRSHGNTLEISGPFPLSPSQTSTVKYQRDETDDMTDTATAESIASTEMTVDAPVVWAGFANVLQVRTPNNQMCSIVLRNNNSTSVQDIVAATCEKKGLNPLDHFLRLKIEAEDGEFACEVPQENELFIELSNRYPHCQAELCQKFIHTVILSKPDEGKGFGFLLETVQAGSLEPTALVVSKVDDGSPADNQGISEGDEVLLINDEPVHDLGWEKISSAIKSPSISITLRTSQIEMPFSGVLDSNLLNSLICPAPPSHDTALTKEILSELIIPMPSLEPQTSEEDGVEHNRTNDDVTGRELSPDRSNIDDLKKDSEAISKQVRRWTALEGSEDWSGLDIPWSSRDRLKKILDDLVETEINHMKLLDTVVERYIKPLKKESFLSQEEVDVLKGTSDVIANFQRRFLKNLQDLVNTESVKDESVLQEVLSGLASAFLLDMENFRLYSGLCPSHSKAKELVDQKSNTQLQQFLEARNPWKYPSLQLDTLMGKIILRVSRYSLYLRSLLEYTGLGSTERTQLTDAIEGMDRMVNYINEMQRISETYSPLFNLMLKESGLSEFGVCVNVSQLKYHTKAMWLNPREDATGRSWKKGLGPTILCFVFNTAIVLLSSDKKYKRRSSKHQKETTVLPEEVKFRLILPCVQCGVQDLPDSDGVANMWHILCRPQSSSPVSYLMRSETVEQKATVVHLIRQSIQEQQAEYGSRGGSGWATPTLSLLSLSRKNSATSFSHQSSASPSTKGVKR